MPSVTSYTKVDIKNVRHSIVEVEDLKDDNACAHRVFKCALLFLLCWLIFGLILRWLMLAFVRENCLLNDLNYEWQIYKMKYGKNYSQEEDEKRRQIFLTRKLEINDHNEMFAIGIKSYQKGINMFSDFTAEELGEISCFRPQAELFPADVYTAPDGQNVPESVNWTALGAVTKVKTQGRCGACWAFSATGSLEAQYFLKTRKLVSLSDQNLLDCTGPQGNIGCKGGSMNYAFRYVQNKGIDSEESYPFEGMEGACRYQGGVVGPTVLGYKSVSPSEADLQAAIANIGPISAAVLVSNAFIQYGGGIYYDQSCIGSQPNHAILVVGYGSTEGQDYWLVKNSWGPAWGESGYIRIARNKNNHCGIASIASYPIV